MCLAFGYRDNVKPTIPYEIKDFNTAYLYKVSPMTYPNIFEAFHNIDSFIWHYNFEISKVICEIRKIYPQKRDLWKNEKNIM